MKRLASLVILLLQISAFVSCTNTDPTANEETIKDEGAAITDITFKEYCYDEFDLDKDGKIDAEEANQVTNIIIEGNLGIVSLQGIEIFSNLRSLSASQCSNLKDANLYYNTNLEYIGFANCTGLISVTLPDNIKSIDSRDFYGCIGLTTINLPKNISSIGDNAFAFCTGLSTIVIPNSVKTIGKFAFKSCKNLASISLSEGIQTIGEQAFYNCTGLSSITLPSTITTIGDVVCVNCTGLRTLYCKAINPPSIGGQPFMGCIQLGSIIVPGRSVANYKASSGWRVYSQKIVGSTEF